MKDVLEHLPIEDLQAIGAGADVEPYIHTGPQAETLSATLSITPIAVVNNDVKQLMTWVNSRAHGTVLNMHEPHHAQQYPRQCTWIRTMRKCYFPTDSWSHCKVLRGVLDKSIFELQGDAMPAAIFLWKKTATSKRLYVGTVEIIDKDFDPKSWSIVLLYHPHGTPGGATSRSRTNLWDVPLHDDINVDDDDMPPRPPPSPPQPPGAPPP